MSTRADDVREYEGDVEPAQEELDSDEFWDHTDSDEGEDEDEKAMYSFTAEQKANYLATVAAARARHQTTIARLMSEKEESNLKVKQLESRIERLEAEKKFSDDRVRVVHDLLVDQDDSYEAVENLSRIVDREPDPSSE